MGHFWGVSGAERITHRLSRETAAASPAVARAVDGGLDSPWSLVGGSSSSVSEVLPLFRLTSVSLPPPKKLCMLGWLF